MSGKQNFGTSNAMMIERFQSKKQMSDRLGGGVVAIGNFDGVHRGHQHVLCKAIELAAENNCPAVALTFEPHPRSFFKPQAPVFRLTDAGTKADLLGALGFDGVYECAFGSQLASMTADEFVRSELIDGLACKHVIIGYDFHFGKDRQGSPAFLSENARQFGFMTHIVEKFSDESGEVISSSRIRKYLAEGKLGEANGLLGYSYRVRGTVAAGKQLGRTLGFPTANVSLPVETELIHGVFAVRVGLENGEIRQGVASFGKRPTFDNGAVILEVHIIDFAEDIYGQDVTVYFESFLRSEKKFDSLGALTDQMNHDRDEAIRYLSMMGPRQGLWPVVAC